MHIAHSGGRKNTAKWKSLTALDDSHSTPEALAITETSRERMKTEEEGTTKNDKWVWSLRTYEMRRKLDLQFPSECSWRFGAVGLINDLGVNASVTLFHSHIFRLLTFSFTVFIWISHYLDIFWEACLGLLKSFASVTRRVILVVKRNALWEGENVVRRLRISVALTVNYSI